MSKTGPIILIEDDHDDEEIFRGALKEIGVKNEFIWFSTTPEAFKFLKTMQGQPFLIFCDVNLPIQTGIEFKKQVDDDEQLRKKSIPFLFYSTSVDKKTVTEAYTKMTIQGFFKKEHSYTAIVDRLRLIVQYWMSCEHPTNE